ncbi:hypothetical protein Kpol_1055p47 [Vanderwaltozyma polyspora DSM 70294]|uniref:Ribosomal RNA-processing protein 1 n=1 Tax=Vanderwaltozyma polyspora (strain ATCC 22028 / DSM 70294 / BCRC 21397 / CBS 2163 / NBRC 10782 / NRRL Y-8283 / UCD 57-17) TaxID=436907 RepID=A7TGC1_VANPO|nr:uncharacterized protein Kpol_1055p47 [Vanderwaltozyma polyspora DSM 70294]EDO18691.1 hypothetical protein Kpol_1055p47 [Vanderwaltozyma polyspora DSM 70294]
METSTFVKQLASNNKKVRDNALDKLTKYLNTRQFKESKQLQYDKLWKGLYFAMWFSDRPRPQQRLASELGSLHSLYFSNKDNKSTEDKLTVNDEAFVKFSKAFWKVMCIEWLNIDRHRLDKYLLLIRRVLFQQLKYLQSREWNSNLVDTYIEKVLKGIPLSGDVKIYNGIPMHITDILLDEWERIMRNENENEEQEGSEEEEEEYDYKELVKETPLPKFIEIFTSIRSDLNASKVLKDQIKENLIDDSRLSEWNIIVASEEAEEESGSGSESESETEEWKGF